MPPLHFILVGHCAEPQRSVWLCARLEHWYLLAFWTLLLLKLRSLLQASFLSSRSALLWCNAFCWPDAKAVLTPPVPCSTHLPRFIGKEFTSWNGQIRWMGSVGNSLCSLISYDQYGWVIHIKQHMKSSSHRTSVKWESKRWILRVILVLIPPKLKKEVHSIIQVLSLVDFLW